MIINIGGYRCKIRFERYVNDNTAIVFDEVDDKGKKLGVYGVVTVNLGITFPKNIVAIKSWSISNDIEKILINAGILGEQIDAIPTGYVVAPIYELTDKALEALENQGKGEE